MPTETVTTSDLLVECAHAKDAHSQEELDQGAAWTPIHVDRLAALVRCAEGLAGIHDAFKNRRGFRASTIRIGGLLAALEAVGIEVSDVE